MVAMMMSVMMSFVLDFTALHCYVGDELMIISVMKVAQSTRAAFCQCKVYSLCLVAMVAMQAMGGPGPSS